MCAVVTWLHERGTVHIQCDLAARGRITQRGPTGLCTLHTPRGMGVLGRRSLFGNLLEKKGLWQEEVGFTVGFRVYKSVIMGQRGQEIKWKAGEDSCGKDLWEVAEAKCRLSPRRCAHADLRPHATQHRSPRPCEWGSSGREPRKQTASRDFKVWGPWSPSQASMPSLRTLGSA